MMKKYKFIFLLFLLALVNCTDEEKEKTPEDTQIEREIQFENLKQEIEYRKIKREEKMDSLTAEREKLKKIIEEISGKGSVPN